MNDNNKPSGPKGLMAEMMQGSAPHKQRKTSLNRETQVKIGKQLEITYNEVVSQGVPDRFAELIRKLDASDANPQVQSAGDKNDGRD